MCPLALLLVAQTLWMSPENRNPVVVILGSSTAAGVGASQPSASWAAGLEQRLAAHGIRVVNQSIPGCSTAASLARFDRDVTPHRPAFVLLATSIVNEGVLADPAGAFDRYALNTAALIDRVRQIGAIPVLMTMYPHNLYSPASIELVRRWTDIAESTGWPVLNFMSALSDPEGRWLRALTLDGVHPVDAGHRQMLEAIPDSLFPALLREQPDPPHPPGEGSWRAPEDAAGDHSLRVRLHRPVSSWTVAAFIRDPAMTEDVDYFVVSGERPIRLARRWNRIELWAGEERIWARTAPPFGWRHFALAYQALTGHVRVLIDGALWGEAAGPVDAVFDAVNLAGRCRGCNISRLLVHRTNLHPRELAAPAPCPALRRSLEFRSALSVDSVANEAQTLTTLEFDGPWSVDRDSPPPVCEPAGEGGRQ